MLDTINKEISDNISLMNKSSFFSKLLSAQAEVSESKAIDIPNQIQKEQNIAVFEENDEEKGRIYRFLRINVLIPLKNHMFEHKKNRSLEDDERKIRIYLAVAIVKVIYVIIGLKKE